MGLDIEKRTRGKCILSNPFRVVSGYEGQFVLFKDSIKMLVHEFIYLCDGFVELRLVGSLDFSQELVTTLVRNVLDTLESTAHVGNFKWLNVKVITARSVSVAVLVVRDANIELVDNACAVNLVRSLVSSCHDESNL